MWRLPIQAGAVMRSRSTGLRAPALRAAPAFGMGMAMLVALVAPAGAVTLKEAVDATIAKHPILQRDLQRS